jgi:hypothetical protein
LGFDSGSGLGFDSGSLGFASGSLGFDSGSLGLGLDSGFICLVECGLWFILCII